jgi:8-oxo-dGTP pyrophosphatase MutT (NUDIX family)
MRQSIASIAVIRRQQGRETRWLAQWNRKWQRLQLVGGHKRQQESFRECVVREIAEELGLWEGEDIRVAPRCRRHLEYEAYSVSARQQTWYILELFDVDWLRDSARARVSADPINCWLSEGEIRANRTKGGILVSETAWRVLREADLVSAGPVGLASRVSEHHSPKEG